MTYLQSGCFDMGTYQYDKGDISKAENIVAKFEENVAKAQKAIESWDENTMMNEWKMEMEEIRSFRQCQNSGYKRFLYNHLYHHRGELGCLFKINRK
jgi:hypothetical protein